MMIQQTIIDSLAPDVKVQVQTAFAILRASGIWESHIALEKQKLFIGSETEESDKLAERILETRKRVNVFTELQTLEIK